MTKPEAELRQEQATLEVVALVVEALTGQSPRPRKTLREARSLATMHDLPAWVDAINAHLGTR